MFESKKELKEQLYDAEQRASSHFTKLWKIDSIITKGEYEKKPYAFIIEDIKKILVATDYQSNN